MKVSSIRFERLTNLGNFENEKIGIEVLLEDGDTAKGALERARLFVEAHSAKERDPVLEARLRQTLAHPDDFEPRQVRDAQEVLDRWSAEQAQEEDIGF